MSNFNDVRKLFQDFLAPELCTLTEKIESLRIDQGQIRHDYVCYGGSNPACNRASKNGSSSDNKNC